MTSSKHAYLIMAHNNISDLLRLLRMIDDERNDIYLHIDLKAKELASLDFDKLTRKSNLSVIESMDVRWGHVSQMLCEIELLEYSLEGSYEYYHLLSGTDIPIKSQDEIHTFFHENSGKEFVHFDSDTIGEEVLDRYRYYYPIQKYLKSSSSNVISYGISLLNTVLFRMQKFLGIKRTSCYKKISKGANWFSITDDLAKYVVSSKGTLLESFRMTANPDEMFLQTIVINSNFYDNLYIKDCEDDYTSIMRLIDWKRGNPYIWKHEDLKEILESEMLFMRKVDSNIDERIGQHLETILLDSINE